MRLLLSRLRLKQQRERKKRKSLGQKSSASRMNEQKRESAYELLKSGKEKMKKNVL
jgi:hypothetical protein